MTRVISARTGMSGVGLVNHVSQTKTMTYLFHCIFRNRPWLKKFKEKFENYAITFFLRSHSNIYNSIIIPIF